MSRIHRDLLNRRRYATYSYQAQASDPDVQDVLTYALDAKPAGMTVDPSSGLISWTPAQGQLSDFDVVLRVTDLQGAIDIQDFTITVDNVNDPPEFVSSPIESATEELPYQYAPIVNDPDPLDTLTFDPVVVPTGMSVDLLSGFVTWTPTEAQVTTSHLVELMVTDSGGLSATQSFNVTVENVNDPPEITSTPPPTVLQHQLYSYSPVVSDSDAQDVLTFSLDIAPAGMAVDPVLGTVTWTPDQTRYCQELCFAQA